MTTNTEIKSLIMVIHDSGVIAAPSNFKQFEAGAPFEVEGIAWDKEALGWWLPTEMFGNLPLADFASFVESKIGIPVEESSFHPHS